MVKIKQIDREAAASVAVLAEMRYLIMSGRADHHAEPFAAHRQRGHDEAVKAIVEWLRGQTATSYECEDVALLDTADAIERGEPFKNQEGKS